MPRKTYNQVLDEHLYILIAQGNHEAFNKLSKRYYKHAAVLVDDLLRQYTETGISHDELISACADHFPFVIMKFTPGRSSFYTFWKSNTWQSLMDYLVEYSYDGEAFTFKGSFSFDQKNDDFREFSEMIGERGDEKAFKRKIFEIKHIIHKFDVFFTSQEKTILKLILEGYSLADFEHTGILAKSQINLTYKSAIEKVRKYLKTPQ